MGLGIACLPDFAISDQLQRGDLVPVLEDHTAHQGTFRLLWPSSHFMSPKLRVFVDFMERRLFPSDRAEDPSPTAIWWNWPPDPGRALALAASLRLLIDHSGT